MASEKSDHPLLTGINFTRSAKFPQKLLPLERKALEDLLGATIVLPAVPHFKSIPGSLYFSNLIHKSALVYVYQGTLTTTILTTEVIIKVTLNFTIGKSKMPLSDISQDCTNHWQIARRWGDNPGLPKFYGGYYLPPYDILVSQKLGSDLNHLLGQTTPPATVYNYAIQMLNLLEKLHSYKFVHGDIKPANIVLDQTEQLALIDFCNSKDIIVSALSRAEFTGTLAYCSLSIHNLNKLSYGDDLESLVYMLEIFLTGILPWYSWTDQAAVKQAKEEFIPGDAALANLLAIARGLKFEQYPDYNILRELFTLN